MDDYDIRLRCLELCGGDFDAAQRAIAFVKGIGVPEITADTWRETYWRCADCGTQWPVDVRCTCIGSSRRDKAAKAAIDPEQSTEAFLAALKSGDEKDELTPGSARFSKVAFDRQLDAVEKLAAMGGEIPAAAVRKVMEQWTPEEVKAIRADRDAAFAQYGVASTGDMVGHEGGSVADELGWNIA